MTLDQLIHDLQKLRSCDEAWGELQVVYSIDDEGNGYKPIYFNASAGHYEDGEWTTEGELQEEGEEIPEGFFNAICVN